ncbi:co-chaperone YbbN [Chroococcidiopsis sp. TS-821]|uniref:thioredoxin family protein n=1 Tax=Chroococcidiopsis sp. TS-821 TaxID=1378066 RepID=UPI000CEEF4B1|nr:thioredoxin family protein [Chroococcidiopsis sp. TS-821]PPS46019.1 thiol reductase thioredoxin [Chroococcidiopsis sp. TS-821]
MVLSVSERTFTQEVLASPIPVLVHFWAPWCGLCRSIEPLLLQFQEQNKNQVKVVGVNADENFKLANSFRLTTLPTLILVDQGNLKHRWESFHGYAELRAELEKIQLQSSENREKKLCSMASASKSVIAEWDCRSA